MIKHFQIFLFGVTFFLGHVLQAEIPKKSPEVLSLSAAIVDHFFLITEEQLRTIILEKGTWAPIDYLTLSNLLENNPNISNMIPGGSGINVIKGLAHFKHQCAVIGKVGSDEKGEFFLRSIQKLGIETLMQKEQLPTGQAICFITPDSERTFRSYMGASHSLTEMKLNDKDFQKSTLFHLEGFQLIDSDLVLQALEKAKKANLLVSMDLANIEIVRNNKEFLLNILPKYVDFVFCNESEAKELTGLLPKEACTYLASLCKIAVVTMSHQGSWAQSGKSLFYTPAFTVNAIDSTGAGDLFAAGFLHGVLCNESLQKCAWLGSLTASYVVKVIGSEIPEQIWEEIHKRIEEEDPFKMTLFHYKYERFLEENLLDLKVA